MVGVREVSLTPGVAYSWPPRRRRSLRAILQRCRHPALTGGPGAGHFSVGDPLGRGSSFGAWWPLSTTRTFRPFYLLTGYH